MSFVLVRRGAPLERVQRYAEAWTEQAVQYLKPDAVPELLSLARFFIVLTAALDGLPGRARRRLLHLAGSGSEDGLNADPAVTPSADSLVLASCGKDAFETTLHAIRSARTAFDELLSVRDHVVRKEPLPALRLVGQDPEIAAIRRFVARGRFDKIRFLYDGADYCPVHARKLPSAMAYRLRTHGLATTDCCDCVLVNLRP